MNMDSYELIPEDRINCIRDKQEVINEILRRGWYDLGISLYGRNMAHLGYDFKNVIVRRDEDGREGSFYIYELLDYVE